MADNTSSPKRKKVRRQHGTGSILELGPDRFRLGYDYAAAGEKRKQRFEVFHGSKSAAKVYLASLIESARKGGTASNDAITFAELSDRFIEAKRVSREGTTVQLYERTLNAHVRPVIGKVRVRKLTAAHITRLLNEAKDTSRRKSKGNRLSPSYRRALRTLVGAVCEYGVRTDVLARNPVKMVEVPSAGHKEHLSFSRDDIANLIKASASHPLEPVILFALGTGLRRGEICGLRWSDIDMSTGEFRLQRNAKNLGREVVVGKLKTAKSARQDVLPSFVLKALKEHRVAQIARHLALGIRPADGYVFDSLDGSVQDPNELSRMFHRFIQWKGVRPIRFHDLRHIYATSAFSAGVPLKIVSESLGHSSLAVTSAVYVDVIDESKREKAAILEGYLGDAVRRGQRSGTSDT
jgi:integrase